MSTSSAADLSGHLAEGRRLLDAGEAAGALAAFAAAHALDAASEAACTGLAHAHNVVGLQVFADDAAEARTHFEAAHALLPDVVDVLLNLFEAQAALGDAEAATATVEKALALAPDAPDVRVMAARLALSLGDEAAARTHLDALRAVAPDHPALGEEAEGVVPGLVSIVIATVTLDYLEACLASIERHAADYPHYEIIVVNDGSQDAALRAFMDAMPHRALHLPENVGFAKANNAGFEAARGEYVMTMNADTLAHPGWLKALVDTLESDPRIGAVAPTVLDMGTDVIQSGGSDWDDTNFRKYVTRHVGQRRGAVPEIETAYPVDGLVGVCVLFRREALFGVGGFDEGYLNGWEDMDLSVALLEAGWQLYHAPGVIEHKGSFVRNTFQPAYYQELVRRNRARFLQKWAGVRIVQGRFVRAGASGDGEAVPAPSVAPASAPVEPAPDAPRVCIVTHDLTSPESVAGPLSERLYLAGHRVTLLFVPEHGADESIPAFEAHFAARGIAFSVLPPPTVAYACAPVLREAYEVYRWLQARDGAFDVVHFETSRGAGSYAVRARRQGLAFARTRLVTALARPHLWQRQQACRPLDGPDDLIVGALEQTAVEQSDRVWGEAALVHWAVENGWTLPSATAADALAAEQVAHEAALAREAPEDRFYGPLPLVSVCVPTYNRPDHLREAIASLRRQDYPHLEVVLVDDGSTRPEVGAVLEGLAGEFRVRGWQIVRQPNAYLGAARNTALQHARGTYVLFMDDDNLACPHEVSTFVRAALTSGADVLTCVQDRFVGGVGTTPETHSRKLFVGGAAAAGTFMNVFGDANALVRRAVGLALGGFATERAHAMQDWEFFARATLAGYRVDFVPEPLFHYRIEQGSMMQTADADASVYLVHRAYADALPAALRPLASAAYGSFARAVRTPSATDPLAKILGALQAVADAGAADVFRGMAQVALRMAEARGDAACAASLRGLLAQLGEAVPA